MIKLWKRLVAWWNKGNIPVTPEIQEITKKSMSEGLGHFM
jgi:hypothetical protein